MPSDVAVVVVGAGAAGIAAARRLHEAGVDCLLIEARDRLGGRAWTVDDEQGHALDLGCGWLHSADRNPWRTIAERQNVALDKTPPPWMRRSLEIGFPRAKQDEFLAALGAFFDRLERRGEEEPDRPATALLESGCRWNPLINAVSTYMTGVELGRLSMHDFARYEDTGINWRAVGGYGALIGSYGTGLAAELDCRVETIDHSGKRLRLETSRGGVVADRVIVTIPTSLVAEETLAFVPALPDKITAARGLPLGLADKLFLSLKAAEEFDKEVRLFGRTDRVKTGAYHIRPFGRALIEVYFGGELAAELEQAGDGAFFDFAVSELVGLFGGRFAPRLEQIRIHRWGRDPLSRGSYSYAVPGSADCRRMLAEPVDDRLFFAGEACSEHDFSTAHGGFSTGVEAAERVLGSLTGCWSLRS
jgi:monoamine oxidase